MIYMDVSENGVVPPTIAIFIGENKLSKFGASCFQTTYMMMVFTTNYIVGLSPATNWETYSMAISGT